MSIQTLGPNQSAISLVLGALSLEVRKVRREADGLPYLMLKSRMNGFVTPLPHVTLQRIKYNWKFTFYNVYASAHGTSRFRCLCVT